MWFTSGAIGLDFGRPQKFTPFRGDLNSFCAAAALTARSPRRRSRRWRAHFLAMPHRPARARRHRDRSARHSNRAGLLSRDDDFCAPCSRLRACMMPIGPAPMTATVSFCRAKTGCAFMQQTSGSATTSGRRDVGGDFEKIACRTAIAGTRMNGAKHHRGGSSSW